MTRLLAALGSKKPGHKIPGSNKRRNKAITGTALASAAAVLITGAIIYPGFKTTEVELNDGGVWVVSKSKNAVGRLNYPSRVLDGAVTPAGTTFDVLQDAGTVFVDDSAGSTLNQVSAAQLRLGAGIRSLPVGRGEFRSKVISVTDAAKGRVWALSPSTVNGFDEENSEPVLTGSPGLVSVVGSDDRIYSADPKSGQVTVTSVNADGGATGAKSESWDGLKGAGDLQLAVVGTGRWCWTRAGGSCSCRVGVSWRWRMRGTRSCRCPARRRMPWRLRRRRRC